MQKNAVRRHQVDWVALRRDAWALAKTAQTPTGTYQAIRFVLERLEEHHGGLLQPDEVQRFQEWIATNTVQGHGLSVIYPECVVIHIFPGGSAEGAGIRVGDVVEAVNGESPRPLDGGHVVDLGQGTSVRLTLRRANRTQPIMVTLTPGPYRVTEMLRGHRLEGDIGYIDVPQVMGATAQTYVTVAHQVLQELDRKMLRRWVVDLRHNIGGNLYVMLASVGPLLGEGEIGGLVNAKGVRYPWAYRDGGVFVGKSRKASTRAAYRLKYPMPMVAVLTSRLTASAGEAVVMAFRERPKTCSFGESTAGVPTGLEDKRLSDGSLLRISSSLFSDRTGQTYLGPIPPDQPIEAAWNLLGTDRDPVLRSAVDWLSKSVLKSPPPEKGDRVDSALWNPRPPYPTDLTDHEWTLIPPYGPTAKPRGQPEDYPKRDLLNALGDMARTGWAGRLRPHDFPPWPIVSHYFRQWCDEGTWP
jgi:carboxyl-terminal processing protease